MRLVVDQQGNYDRNVGAVLFYFSDDRYVYG